MKQAISAALLAFFAVGGAVHADDMPMIHKVELKTGGLGYLLTCHTMEQCSGLGPRLCPGKTAMWSDSTGKFSNVPVTMRNNGSDALMVVKCE